MAAPDCRRLLGFLPEQEADAARTAVTGNGRRCLLVIDLLEGHKGERLLLEGFKLIERKPCIGDK